MDSDIGPTVDPAMAILTNRLPFMDLSDVCKEYNYSFACVWRPMRSKTPGKGEVLMCDKMSSIGDFAMAMEGVELAPGEGVAGRCFEARDVAHSQSIQTAGSDPRHEKAKEHGVRGAFAIWRDGAVYEFGGSPPMEDAPAEFIAGIGGSTGVMAAAKAVQAVVRLGAMAKKSKAAKEEAASA